MIRVLLNNNGTIRGVLGGHPDIVALNTESNAIYVDVDNKPQMDAYWDFDTFTFIDIGDAPSEHHQFSYTAKEWFDSRTLIDLKNEKWEQFKKLRDDLEFGGFEFEGHIYDSDRISQGRIMGAAMSQTDQVWTVADNTTVSLTATQLASLYATLQIHVANAHARGRTARQALDAATTVEEIDAIIF